MAELLVRASTLDAALLRRIYGLEGRPAVARRPSRIVVDAHTPLGTGDIGATARRAGVPLLIDPQTFYLQGVQHTSDPWASHLPFGRADQLSPADCDAFAQEQLVAAVVSYQVHHGATAIIAPYVHIDRLDSEWIDIQAGLWQRTRRYLDRENIALPVTAVLAIGWRVLHPTQGYAALAPALSALSMLEPREVALAASKIDQGVRPQDRAMDLVLMIERLRRDIPVIVWQQGHLGELAVAAGAAGYECGIGWRERCDLGVAAGAHRHPQLSGTRSPRPVFISALGRSVPKQSLEALGDHRELWLRVMCADVECCPAGGAGLLGDARAHAVVQRRQRLDQIDRIARPVWRWQHLAETADEGLNLAQRLNRQAAAVAAIKHIDTGALQAISAVSHTRRVDTRSRRVA
jgi:hypothetical protein